jgi:hypothetical protein
MDNFLPCIINETGEEDELQAALKASIMGGTTTTTINAFAGTGYTLSGSSSDGSSKQQQEQKLDDGHGSSKYDPFCMSDKNRQVLANTENFLQQHQTKPVNPYAKPPPNNAAASGNASLANIPSKLDRIVTTQDLAYSKAKNMQLWVRVNTFPPICSFVQNFISLDFTHGIFCVGAIFGKGLCQESWFVSSH